MIDPLANHKLRQERILNYERSRHYFAQVTDSVVMVLRDLESALDQLDRELDVLQPGHSGRVRLMWESRNSRLRGYDGERVPSAVAWHRHQLRKTWSAKRLPLARLSQRAMSSGDFEATAPQVREVLADLQTLLELHQQTRRRLSKLDGDWAKALPQVTRRLVGVAKRSERSLLAKHD